MTYELALKLKNTGFPFNPNRDWGRSDFAYLPSKEITKDDREKLWIPTLSELIEACGYGFRDLVLHTTEGGHRWSAKAGKKSGGFLTNGFTAEEAVAKLWLKLNAKT